LETFLPAEAAELARSRIAIMSGFGFLHYRNRPFEYYQQALRLVRYFGRHYYLSLRYLKVVCGRRYVDVFEQLLGVAEDVLVESIRSILDSLPVDKRAFGRALYDYESACDSLIDIDIQREIENVYAQLRQRGAGAGYIMVDLEADVLSQFPNGNVSNSVVGQGLSLECQATTYLIYLSAAGSRVTIRLSTWQREIWEQLEVLGVVDTDQIARAVASTNAVPFEKAQAAVESARSTFAQIQAELRSLESQAQPR
jgi:hypothetical protein